MMIKYLFFGAIIMLSSACNTSSTTSNTIKTDIAATDTGWVTLFDGHTTRGWHTYGKNTIGEAWKAENGVLHLDASKKDNWQTAGGGDILTDSVFDDFDLELEWKISEAGNSGIMVYIQEDTSKYEYPWHTGPEIQVADNEKNEDGKIPKHMAGDLYDLLAAEGETIHPAGKWNKVRILANDGRLTLFMNNKQVLQTSLWDESWRNLISKSKFTEWPAFGTFKKGHIGLQDHGADVWFRNIRIKKL